MMNGFPTGRPFSILDESDPIQDLSPLFTSNGLSIKVLF